MDAVLTFQSLQRTSTYERSDRGTGSSGENGVPDRVPEAVEEPECRATTSMTRTGTPLGGSRRTFQGGVRVAPYPSAGLTSRGCPRGAFWWTFTRLSVSHNLEEAEGRGSCLGDGSRHGPLSYLLSSRKVVDLVSLTGVCYKTKRETPSFS